MSVKRVDSLVPHPRILETLPLAGALSETLVGTLKGLFWNLIGALDGNPVTGPQNRLLQGSLL